MSAPTRRSRYSSEDSESRSCPPPWAWLLAGILIGIALSFFVYLREILPYTVQQPPPQTAAPTPTATPTATATAPPVTPVDTAENSGVVAASVEDGETVDRSGPRFEFYDVLPEQQVNVPNRPRVVANDNTPPGADSEIQTEADNPVTTKPVTAPGTYVLQVGSFRDLREAEGLKAHLALLGISAHIERATLSGNDVWHRVRLGPFNNLSRLNQTRSQLAQNNITSMVLQF